MTRLLILLLMAGQCWGVYSKKIPLTIQSGKVSGGPHTNYTFFVDQTIADLKHTGSGGFVTNTNGYDLVPSQDSDCSTKLNFRRELYVSTTGQIVLYGLKSSFAQTDTIWLCFADSGVTTDQQNATAAYDSNHIAVYHFPDGTTLSTNDATSNGHNAASNSLTAASGKIGTGSAANNGSQSMTVTSTTALNITAPITIEGWFNTSNGTANAQIMLGKGTGSIYRYLLTTFNSGNMSCQMLDSGGSYTLFLGSTTTLSNNTWYHFACTCDGTNGYLYVNGVQENTAACSNGNNSGSANDLTVHNGSVTSYTDDLKIHNTARSVGWILTEVNMATQSTFWTVGATQNNGSTARPRRIFIQ